MCQTIRCVLHLSLMCWLVPRLATAQLLWMDWRADQALGLEILKPEFDGPDNATFTTSAAALYLRLPVAPRVLFVADARFAHFGVSGLGSSSEDAFGNPYLGVEVRTPGGRVFGEFGLRLPTAPDNTAAFVGIYTNLDYLESYLPDILPVTAMLNYRFRAPSGVVTRWRMGPSLWIDAGGNQSESELVLGYSGQVGYEGRDVSLLSGLSGQLAVTEDGNFGERTLHQVVTAVSVGSGRFRPGAQIRVPLDRDLTDVLNFVVGLSLAVALP